MSDVHAGYRATSFENSQGVNAREADGYIALDRVVSSIIESGVDCVVIAGDLFHTPLPDIRTIVFVQNELRRFWRAGIAVYSLAGNHEVTDVASDIASSRVVHDPERHIYSFIEPYTRVEIAPGIVLHMISHHQFSEQDATMDRVEPVAGAVNILTTHGSVIDPILQVALKNKRSPREIVIPDRIINLGWDYVMLGHIHERKFVKPSEDAGDEDVKIFYNGSILRRGFSDAEGKLGRGWTEWRVDGDGVFSYEFHNVAQRPQFDLPVIDCRDLSSGEITDRIVANLQSTQVDGAVFDLRTAPILRQTVTNITQAKRVALNYGEIQEQSQHALAWNLRMSKLRVSPSQVLGSEQVEGDDVLLGGSCGADAGDIVSVYDRWVSSSQIVQSISDSELRDRVVNQSKDFLSLGQEVVLNEFC